MSSTEPPKLVSMTSLIRESIDDLTEKLSAEKNSMGILTGIPDLDDVLGGYQPPDEIIVAARPGVGKSAFLGKNVISALDQGKRINIFSLEMSNKQFIQRMILNKAKIDGSFIRTGGGHLDFVTRDSWRIKMEQAAVELFEKGDQLMMCESKTLTIDQLIGLSKEGARPNIIFVDYLQLVHGTEESRGRDRHVEVASVSRGLKILAKDLWIPIVAAAQIRRPGGDTPRPPTVNDLRESGSIEQDADQVILLHRSEVSRPDGKGKSLPESGEIEIIIAKNRHGKTTVLSQFYIGSYLDFLPEDPYVTAFRDGEERIKNGTKNPFF